MVQYFQWRAVYNDGTSVDELCTDGTETSFYDIDKSRLAQFIMHGKDIVETATSNWSQ